MTRATGEFRSVLSRRDVQTIRTDTAKPRAARQMLSDEAKPLVFTFRWADGRVDTVEMYGSGYEPASFWRIMNTLVELSALQAGWNSYDAQPLNANAVRRFVGILPDILREDTPEPIVMPTHDGGIQFEWHTGGIDLEVKVPPSPAEPMSYLLIDANSGEEHEGPFDGQIVRAALTRMAAVA